MASVGTLAGCEFMGAINPHAGSHKILGSWCRDGIPPCGVPAQLARCMMGCCCCTATKEPKKPWAIAFARGRTVHVTETFKQAWSCVPEFPRNPLLCFLIRYHFPHHGKTQ